MECNDNDKTWQVTDAHIATRVGMREQARSSSDWAAADAVRDELKGLGVTVDDKTKLWTCEDGRSGAVPMWERQ